jgi:opacity protein-like surface antigen
MRNKNKLLAALCLSLCLATPALSAETLYVRLSGGISSSDKLSTLSSNPLDILHGSAKKTAAIDAAFGWSPPSTIPLIGFRTEAAFTARPTQDFVTTTISSGKTSNISLKGQDYTGMGNIYMDVTTVPFVKPYLGAGAGIAHSTVDGSDTNFAWNLMAGATIKVIPLVSFDIMVRHVDAGQLKGRALTSSGTSTLSFDSHLTTNEALVGVKFGF